MAYDLDRLKEAFINADKAGDTAAAKEFALKIREMQSVPKGEFANHPKPTPVNVEGDQWKENLKTEGNAGTRAIAAAGAAMNDQFRNVKRIFAGDDTKGIQGQSDEEIQALSGLNMPANIVGHIATVVAPGAVIKRGSGMLPVGRVVAEVLGNAGLAAATSKDRGTAAGMSAALDVGTRGLSRAARGLFTPTAAAREATEAGLPLTLGQQVRGNGVVGNAINAIEEGAMVANPARDRARQAGTDAIFARTIGRRGQVNPGMGASTSPLEDLATLKAQTGHDYDAAFSSPVPTQKVVNAIDSATNSIPLPGVRREYAAEMNRDMLSQIPRGEAPPRSRGIENLFASAPAAPYLDETDGDTVRRLIQNFRDKGKQVSADPTSGNRLEKIAASRQGRHALLNTLPNADEIRSIQREFADIDKWEKAAQRAANVKQGGTVTPGKLLEVYRNSKATPEEKRFIQSMTSATADVLPDSGTAIRSRVLNGGALGLASLGGGYAGNQAGNEEDGVRSTLIGAALPFAMAYLGGKPGIARALTGQTGVQKRLNTAIQAAGNRSPLIRDSLQTMIATTPKHAIEGEEDE